MSRRMNSIRFFAVCAFLLSVNDYTWAAAAQELTAIGMRLNKKDKFDGEFSLAREYSAGLVFERKTLKDGILDLVQISAVSFENGKTYVNVPQGHCLAAAARYELKQILRRHDFEEREAPQSCTYHYHGKVQDYDAEF